jgi:hypothetical protein
MNWVENRGEENSPNGEAVPASVKVAADRAKAEARQISEERRAHRRVAGGTLAWMHAARVGDDGREVGILDVSRGGALLESGRPLRPGSRQSLEIAGPEKSIVIPFGVLRSRISALEPRGAIYRVACAFNWLLELPELAAVSRSMTSAPLAAEPLMDTVLREVAASDSVVIPGWQEVVARFVDGTILKGYSNDFDVSRPSFSLRTSAERENQRVSVPLTRLKAVFFARDFEEESDDRAGKTFMSQTLGRRVHLTFADGEMLIGMTKGYRAGGAGFFVAPADPRANHVRIFVPSGALRQIRFP